MFELTCGLGLSLMMILLALYYEMICGIGLMYFIIEVVIVVLIAILFNKKIL